MPLGSQGSNYITTAGLAARSISLSRPAKRRWMKAFEIGVPVVHKAAI